MCLPSRDSNQDVACSFEHPVNENSKKLSFKPQSNEETNFPSKNLFQKYEPLYFRNAVLTNSLEKLRETDEIVSLNVPKWWKKVQKIFY